MSNFQRSAGECSAVDLVSLGRPLGLYSLDASVFRCRTHLCAASAALALLWPKAGLGKPEAGPVSGPGRWAEANAADARGGCA